MERNEDQNARVQLPFTEKSQPIELTAEIALPDYRSEISRLLWVRPVLQPPTRFIGGGKVDFSGPVRYHILYVGPDGGLYSAEHEEGYAFSLSLDGPGRESGGEELAITAEAEPEAVITRVIGPRKLSVRCRLRAHMQGYAVRSLSPRVSGEGELHRLCHSAENGRVTFGEPERLTCSGHMTVDVGEGELRVVSAIGHAIPDRVTASDGAVHCTGEVVVSLLLVRENGDPSLPFAAECRLPFESELPLEGAASDAAMRVTGAVGEIRCTVEGETVSVEATVALVAEGQSEESVLLCDDLFSPGRVAEYRTVEEKFWRAGLCTNRNFSISQEKTMAELGLGADVERILTVADVEVREKHPEGEKTLLSGDLCCHLLCRRGGEYAVCDFSIPFRTFLEGAWDHVSLSCVAPCCRVSTVRDGEALRVDAEIYMSLRGSGSVTDTVLAEARFAPSEETKRVDMEICYPAVGETLWSVCKRYGISPESLANANAISAEAPGAAESLAGVRYLLIP